LLENRALLRRGLSEAFRDESHGPLPALLLALTLLAGVLDAISILRLGGVFVATMTGNLVFVGLAAAGARGFAVGTSLLAVGGFAIGVLIGSRVCEGARSHRGVALRNVLRIHAGPGQRGHDNRPDHRPTLPEQRSQRDGGAASNVNGCAACRHSIPEGSGPSHRRLDDHDHWHAQGAREALA
jgi:hypothetical protein